MYTKIYQIKLTSLTEGKIAASYVAEELGGSIAKHNMTGLNIFLCKEGSLYVTINFDDISEMKAFEAGQEELFNELKQSFTCRAVDYAAVPVFRYEREATNAALSALG